VKKLSNLLNEAKELFIIFKDGEPYEVVSSESKANKIASDFASHPMNSSLYEVKPYSVYAPKLRKLKPDTYKKLLKLAKQNKTPMYEPSPKVEKTPNGYQVMVWSYAADKYIPQGQPWDDRKKAEKDAKSFHIKGINEDIELEDAYDIMSEGKLKKGDDVTIYVYGATRSFHPHDGKKGTIIGKKNGGWEVEVHNPDGKNVVINYADNELKPLNEAATEDDMVSEKARISTEMVSFANSAMDAMEEADADIVEVMNILSKNSHDTGAKRLHAKMQSDYDRLKKAEDAMADCLAKAAKLKIYGGLSEDTKIVESDMPKAGSVEHTGDTIFLTGRRGYEIDVSGSAKTPVFTFSKNGKTIKGITLMPEQVEALLSKLNGGQAKDNGSTVETIGDSVFLTGRKGLELDVSGSANTPVLTLSDTSKNKILGNITLMPEQVKALIAKLNK